MPDFEYKGKAFYNPVEFALEKIGGRWKMPILWRLQHKVYRTGELKRDIKGISQKMLTQQLRELEKDGYINRKVYPEVPPRVEYSITKVGRTTIPIIDTLRKWGISEMKREGIDLTNK
ncbi:MAG: helix-turn-helix domain-containing protein [Gracilimonas sp.]|jgi:DNA-binding HxlR family transcriptional regulator|nr:helix-turn-helix domain-containing protein [Gracilimonas sp.]